MGEYGVFWMDEDFDDDYKLKKSLYSDCSSKSNSFDNLPNEFKSTCSFESSKNRIPFSSNRNIFFQIKPK